MKYIIMCGGQYDEWSTPRQLTKINGQPIVARTIRLLKQNRIADIAISATNNIFQQFRVPVLYHNNFWKVHGYNNGEGAWVNGFYLTNEPVCYLFGDVVFSPEAIQTIINIPTNDIEFFASSPPFAPDYFKQWAEPFAFKVTNTQHFKFAIQKTKEYKQKNYFNRDPIAWEFWQVIKNTPLNIIDYSNYVTINDYTCDIDSPSDIEFFKNIK